MYQMPKLSAHFKSRNPSEIRLAQIEFMKRDDGVEAVNTAIGNVSLPMHPAMQKRMENLKSKDGPFYNGVVKYSATVGLKETNKAFLNIIASSGLMANNLYSQITDGGSQAMELAILGVCGEAGSDNGPLLLIDAAYTNYNTLASRLGRKTVSVCRHLKEDGKFTLPDFKEIEEKILKYRPNGMVVIPYDNPTGNFLDHESMMDLGKLCVKHNMWMISDEAYRELFYLEKKVSSIWGITDKEVPGIEGRRISIETASKVWNACGLRIGALITDNHQFHNKSVFEYTANLCSNVIGQYIFGALAHETIDTLRPWYQELRSYYKNMLIQFTDEMKKRMSGLIVSAPDASIYSVLDVRNIARPGFDAQEFVMYCAREGKCQIDNKNYTLLVSPMAGFYNVENGAANPGVKQMRVAFVEVPSKMKLVPQLFQELFYKYELKVQE